MARRLALLVLLVSTFFTALIGSAFARHEQPQIGSLLGASPLETMRVPPHLGGGTRESYQVKSSMTTVLTKLRFELVSKGWKEISLQNSPARTLFVRGFQELQVFQGKVQVGESVAKATSRLAARSIAWEPDSQIVSIVFDSPSDHPIDRTLSALNDLRSSIEQS